MAYNENHPTREMTPPEQMAQVASRIAQSSAELTEAGNNVYETRKLLDQQMGSLGRVQAEFDSAIGDLRSLMDQHGLIMSIPMDAPKVYRA
jgi:hypothetical protein